MGLNEPIPHLTAVLEKLDLFVAAPVPTECGRFLNVALANGRYAQFSTTFLSVVTAYHLELYIKELVGRDIGICPF